MKVKALYGDGFFLTKGKVYEVVAVEQGPDPEGIKDNVDWYRIVGDMDLDFIEPADTFEVVA